MELARRFEAKIHLLHSYPVHIGGIAPYGMVGPESFERDCRDAAAKHLDQWAYLNGVKLDFSRPSKPMDNAFIESFNGRFRQECLNENWFLSIEDAREKVEEWRRHYNEERPHGALGNLAPVEFAAM